MLITHVTLSKKGSEKGTGPFDSGVLSPFRTPFRTKRHGIVLLVVMAMLALFATVALSFVFYAESEATMSRYASQAETQTQADVDPETLLSYYLSQLIFDTDNVYSAMRGHSLGRNMYGYNPADLNAIPYNGMGRLRFDVPHALLDGKPAAPEPAAKNNMLLINYQNFYGNQGGTLRDPEKDAQGNYVGGNVHWTYPDLNNMFLGAVAGGGDVLMPSFHRPWMGVAFGPNSAKDPWAKYMTLRPHVSYHDQFSSPDWDGVGDVKNLEWGPGTRIGVRGYANNDSIWMDLGFPVLTAPNGKRYKPMFAALIVDLDNKINLYVHGNIMNTNNKEDPNNPHFSNQGWGWWEVNLGKVVNQPITPARSAQTKPIYGTEWTKLFRGSPIARYGPDGKPDAFGSSPMNNANTPPFSIPVIPPYYSQIDVGGLTGYRNLSSSTPVTTTNAPIFKYMYLPGDPQDPLYANNKINMIHTYPDYPPHWDNGMGNDMVSHASGYDPFAVPTIPPPPPPVPATAGTTPSKDDRIALAMSQIEALYRYQGTGSPAMTSDLFANLPINMQNARVRWLSTLRSMDLDRPGLVPYNWKNVTSNPTTPPSDYVYDPVKKYPTTTAANPAVVTFPKTLTNLSGEFAPIDPATGSPARPSDGHSYLYNKGADGTDQLRVLLNRNLTPYPAYDTIQGRPKTGLIDFKAGNNLAQFNKAVTDRVNMATDLYNMLVKVTGARDPRLPKGKDLPPTSPEYQAARWLAQLALNIVDFIDEDDYMTPWQWVSGEWLFGTELPHLLLNEVYAQVDNDASDTTLWPPFPAPSPLFKPKATNYRVNFWIELHNPMRPPIGSGLFPRDNGQAILQSNSQNNFRVVVTTGGTGPNNNFNPAAPTNDALFIQPLDQLAPVNTDPPRFPPVQAPKSQVVDNFPFGVRVVDVSKADSPKNSYYTEPIWNQGFYVLGPDPPKFTATNKADPNYGKVYVAPSRDPKLPLSAGNDTTGKQTLAKFTNLSWVPPVASPEGQTYVVCLQRLANPNIPFQKNPAAPLYNPYITVDYFDNITMTPSKGSNPPDNALHMNVKYDKNANDLSPKEITTFHSVGRKQPYVGIPTRWVAQNPIQPKTGQPPQPFNTFFQHNGRQPTLAKETAAGTGRTLDLPFWWPVHMDRQLVNPMELLNVSCYRPWEFTQKFGLGNNDHRAPWDQQSTLLYRLLEVTQTPYFVRPSRSGVLGGRVTGKININTIWDPEILDALVDNPNIDIPTLFQTFMASRSPGVVFMNPDKQSFNVGGNPGPTDEIDFVADGLNVDKTTMSKPFKSLNVGIYNAQSKTQYPNGLGMENTILRSGLFQQFDNVSKYPNGLAFKKNEVIAKIFNNVTTRSNVFAVWLTVGFFEVVDESVYPVKLGSEIGRSENRHVRHRMFAVVDRTNIMSPDPVQNNRFQTTTTAQVSAGHQKVTLGQVSWNLSSNPPGLVNVNFRIRPGMKLKFGTDKTNPETVTVLDVDYNNQQITANFGKNHPARTAVGPDMTMVNPTIARPPLTPGSIQKSILANPGPQDAFDPRQNTLVVSHFSIIQ